MRNFALREDDRPLQEKGTWVKPLIVSELNYVGRGVVRKDGDMPGTGLWGGVKKKKVPSDQRVAVCPPACMPGVSLAITEPPRLLRRSPPPFWWQRFNAPKSGSRLVNDRSLRLAAAFRSPAGTSALTVTPAGSNAPGLQLRRYRPAFLQPVRIPVGTLLAAALRRLPARLLPASVNF